jgi:chemotaxis response regulator CheB
MAREGFRAVPAATNGGGKKNSPAQSKGSENKAVRPAKAIARLGLLAAKNGNGKRDGKPGRISPVSRLSERNGERKAPLVLIGGSAGSLDMLRRFFALLPGNCGLAFAVAVHLSPNDESSMPELIQRRTALRVLRARDGQLIRANHVYIIPPGRLMKVAASRLRVIPRKQRQGPQNDY